MTVDISNVQIDYDDPIDDWSGEFEFLRNDYPCSIYYEGITYPSVEHAFQAAKTSDVFERQQVANAPTARDAKQLGRAFLLAQDWNERRVEVMEDLLRQKFSSGNSLANELVETGISYLQMANRRDDFWGTTGQGVGENVLGKLLMKLRGELAIILPGPASAPPLPVSVTPVIMDGLFSSSPTLSAYSPVTFKSRLENQGVNPELASLVSDLYEQTKKATERFGHGDKAVLRIIAAQIENDPQEHADIIHELEKTVESFASTLQALEDG